MQPAAPSVYKFFFNIGSIDSFERKMEDAQEDLGISPTDYVPIIYTNELSWQQVGLLPSIDARLYMHAVSSDVLVILRQISAECFTIFAKLFICVLPYIETMLSSWPFISTCIAQWRPLSLRSSLSSHEGFGQSQSSSCWHCMS